MIKDEKNGKDEIWTRAEVDSPCKNICVVHRISGLCIGCYRTAEEIELWNSYSEKERNKLIGELPLRESKAIPKKRSGRAKKISQITKKL